MKRNFETSEDPARHRVGEGGMKPHRVGGATGKQEGLEAQGNVGEVRWKVRGSRWF